MSTNDEFDGIPDSILSSALDAAEGRAPARTPVQQPVPQKVQQPIPQRVSRPAGAVSSIIVSTRQKGNPILSYVKNVPWEYGPPAMAADYLLSPTTCALFLSLKYHKLHPDYIFGRLRALGPNAFTLRVLLVLVDIIEHTDVLRVLTKTCLLNNLTMFLSWSSAEAGRYLETFKMYEHTPPTSIMEKVSEDYGTRMIEVFTRVRGVNKTDAVTLVSTFGSVRAAINASPEEVMMISGWGQQKVARLEKAVRVPFRVGKLKEGRKAKGKGKAPSTSADVAARLGIGNVNMGAPKVSEEWGVIEDDEEALAAVAEFEAVEKERRRVAATGGSSVRATVIREGSSRHEQQKDLDIPSDVGEGIMDALTKLREKKK